jgi:hypothetical protein
MNVGTSQDHTSLVQREKDKVELSWLNAQEKIALLEEEVTQCHAHLDLYKIRLQEEHEIKESLQVRCSHDVHLFLFSFRFPFSLFLNFLWMSFVCSLLSFIVVVDSFCLLLVAFLCSCFSFCYRPPPSLSSPGYLESS